MTRDKRRGESKGLRKSKEDRDQEVKSKEKTDVKYL